MGARTLPDTGQLDTASGQDSHEGTARRGRHRGAHLAAAGHRRRAAPARPDGRGHRPRHPARARGPGGPRGRLPARADPAGAAAAPAQRRPARVPGRLRAAVKGALEVVDRIRPDVVVGFGGYVSVPAYLAARRRGLPLVVHEGNALPGIANKLGARFTPHVATSFPETPLRHATYLGLPIRRMISTLDRAALRAEARATFGLDPDRPTLLVTGGSQGARRINQSVSASAEALAEAGVQVLHVVGPNGEATVEQAAGAPPYVVVPYVDRMDLAYAAADLVVCRAGANTVTEVAAVGLPAVFVPLPLGNGEQALNARPVVDAGGGLLVQDGALTPEWVRATVPALAVDAERLATMSAAASGLIPRDADEKLARMVLAAAGEAAPMRVPVPDELLPADRLGRVHFVGIGGAGLSGIARIMLARGITVSGSDAKESRALEALRALGARCYVGHAAEQVHDVDTLVVSTAVREDNPEVVEARGQGLRLLPRSAALRVGDAGPQGRRGRRHPRQDDHHVAAHRGAPALRRRPVLRDRRRAQRVRLQRPRRQRRDLRRRGRRERRRLPGLLAVRRAGDERRGRPPRQLRHRGGLPRGLHRSSSTGSTPTGFLVVCVDDPGAADLAAAGPRAWARRRRRGGVRRGRPARREPGLRRLRLHVHGRRARPPARRGHRCRSRAATTSSTRSPRWPRGCGSGFAFADLERGLEAFTGTRRRMELKGEVAGVRVYDSYAHHPNEIRGDLQAARSLAGDGRVVVAFQPHLVSRTKIFGADDGRGARRGRRGRGDGRLRRARGPRARRRTARWSPRTCRCRPSRCTSSRPGRPPRRPSSSGRARATWCSPSARATSRSSGRRCWSCSRSGSLPARRDVAAEDARCGPALRPDPPARRRSRPSGSRGKRFARRQWARRWLAWRRRARRARWCWPRSPGWCGWSSSPRSWPSRASRSRAPRCSTRARSGGSPRCRLGVAAGRRRPRRGRRPGRGARAGARRGRLARLAGPDPHRRHRAAVAVAVVDQGGVLRGVDDEGVLFRALPVAAAEPAAAAHRARRPRPTRWPRRPASWSRCLPSRWPGVEYVSVSTVDTISLRLRAGATVHVGERGRVRPQGRGARRAAASSKASLYDVTVPGQPVIRP